MTDAMGEVSDGFHTFNELYAHRIALFIALAIHIPGAWKSRLHADGSCLEGWFIAGFTTPAGPITYHLPDAEWDAFPVQDVPRAPQWDGHTAADVVERLRAFSQQHTAMSIPATSKDMGGIPPCRKKDSHAPS